MNRRALIWLNASSTSAARPSSISPIKRNVRCKLPGSTHLAPATPVHSSDRRSFSSGGNSIPTKRRSMALRSEPRPATPSGEQRQDASMAIEAITRDLAIGEKPDQRKIAEGFADQPGLDPLLAEQPGAAR